MFHRIHRRGEEGSDRAWRPRHVVAIVFALVVGAVLFPVGVKAAGQLVTIVDSTTTNKARVTDGALQTSSYPARAARPVQGVVHCMASNSCGQYQNRLLGPFTAQTKVMLTNAAVESPYADAYLEVNLVTGLPATAGDCSSAPTVASKTFVLPLVSGPSTTANVAFSQPFQVQSPDAASGKQWCVWAEIPNGGNGYYNVVAVGYKA